MGSLFDGIGGFPLAAIHNGVIPLWVSEERQRTYELQLWQR